MFIDRKAEIYKPENLILWFLLAFQGGHLNTGGYLAVHRFVSHVTGFSTLFGVHAVEENWLSAFGMLLVPFIFLCGSMVSAWFIERRKIKGKRPKYGVVFFLIIINLYSIAILGHFGYLGRFGEELKSLRDYYVLFTLSFTCGLQNAVISSASGSIIRTTHLTGPTTDLGVSLVHLFTEKNKSKELIFINWCRAGIIFSFILGSFIGAYTYHHLSYLGFLVPVCISIFVMIRLNIHRYL